MADLLSKNFEDRLRNVKEDAAKVGEGIQNKTAEARPRWMFIWRESLDVTTADGQSTEEPKLHDSDSIHRIFDRTEAEKIYADTMDRSVEGNKFVKHCAIATNQSDVLSGMERDFRLRHRSRIRILAHEGVNKDAMGSDGGQIQAGVLEWMNDEILRLGGPSS